MHNHWQILVKFSTYCKCSAFAKRPIKDTYCQSIISGSLSLLPQDLMLLVS